MAEVLPPGTELANYRIERVVGRGGMGVVHLAEHVHLGRRAALKTISGVHAEQHEFRERFVRESRLAAQIDHPNIVPIYDAGETDGLLYLAMRYVDGEDLDELIEREAPLTPHQIVEVFTQVASALDAAHEEGLVHRDVKPANVLLEPRSGGTVHAYLADFGLTKYADANTGLTATGQVMGTLFYVAPEQIDGREIDGRADQYSLACVLYECLTAKRPFEPSGQLFAILSAHLNDPRPQVTDRRHDLPAAIDAVVARALAVDPHERFATCGEFVAATREALQAEAGAGGAVAPGLVGAFPTGRKPAEPTSESLAPADEVAAFASHEESAADDVAPDTGATGDAEAASDDGAAVATSDVGAAPEASETGERASGRSRADTAHGITPPARPSADAPAADAPEGRRRWGVAAALLGVGALLAVAVVAAVLWLPRDATEPADPVADPDVGDDTADEVDEVDDDPVADDPAAAEPPDEPIVFSSDRNGEYDVFRVESDGSDLVNLTESPSTDDRQATWSPDRDRIVFSSDRDGDFAIYTMAPDGSDVTQVTSGAGRDHDPRFSPDGQQIAFSSQREETRSIHVINVDGTGLQRLTDDGGSDSRPTWSPDGTLIAFHRVLGDDQIDIMLQQAEPGGEAFAVTDRPGRDFHPSWSPSEPELVFASDRDGAEDVFMVDVTRVADGEAPGEPVNLTENADADDWDPNWSPDAQWITFESDRAGVSNVYIMRADGSDVRQIVDSPATDADPGW